MPNHNKKRQPLPPGKLTAWQPLQPAHASPRAGWTMEQLIQDVLDTSPVDITYAEAERLIHDSLQAETYVNNHYVVTLREIGHTATGPAMVHLSIRRADRSQVGPERFRDFQRIKNELVGPECEAVELYPAESRLVDSADQYHLWVVVSPTWRFPFGFDSGRFVVGPREGSPATQTPFREV